METFTCQSQHRPCSLPLENPSISSTLVRTSPYHAYLASLPRSETASLLADNIPTGKSSTIFYLEIAPDGTLQAPEAFTCKLNGCFYWQGDDVHLIALRSRLETSVPYAQRIIAVENILPITVEVFGSSLNLRPRIFQQHVRDKWRPADQPFDSPLPDADVMIPHVWIRAESFGATIQAPRMIDVSSQHSRFSWRQKKLCSMLNDRDASPLLFEDGPVPCYPRLFERITVEIQAELEGKWTGK